jgi:outer membrane protein TolC
VACAANGAGLAPRTATADEPPDAEARAEPARAGFQLDQLQKPGGLVAADVAERAVGSAPSLDRARASARVAEAGARIARTGLLPELTATASYTRLSDVQQNSVTGGQNDNLDRLIEGVDDPEARALFQGITQLRFPVILNRYALEGTLRYAVSDVFFRVLPSYDAARTRREAREAEVQAERADVALRAYEAFFEYARSLASLAIAEASVTQAEAQLRQAVARVEIGAAAPVERYRARARHAAAEGAALRARGGVQIAERALRVLLHVEDDAPIGLGQDLSRTPRPIDATLDTLVDRALDERPEMQALRHVTNASQAQARATAGGRYPSLVLQGGVDYSNPNARIFPQTSEFNVTWQVGAALVWSPDQTLEAVARLDEAEARTEQARADLRSLSDAVRNEVSRTFEQSRTARAAITVAVQGIEAAEESYRVRFEQFRAGAATLNDVVDADAELTSARLDFVNAVIDLHVADARLRHAAALQLPGGAP